MILSLSGKGSEHASLSASEYKNYFDQYYGAIRSFLYYKVGDAQVAEDIAQDTFVKLWENRHKIERKTIKSYLYAIAGNLAINMLKRQQLRFKFEHVSKPGINEQNPEYLVQEAEFAKQLNEVLALIPDGSREVFLMNRIEDLKYREIAERLDISVKAVEKRMSKALQILREKLNIEV